MLPNFLVVGAQKAATTSLHNYISAHPDIFLPSQKETKFFARDDCYARGIAYYESQYFRDYKGEQAVGEVDPDYLFHDVAVERISRHLDLDSLRLIFVFRHPAERAFSHYLMTVRRGYEPLSFEDALAAEEQRMRGDYASRSRYSYVNRGYYMEQVRRFLKYVDKSNMLFLLTKDLQDAPTDTVKLVCEFLGVSADFVPECLGETYHVGTAPRSRFLLGRLQGESLEKQLIRWLIPSASLRQKFRRRIMALNQTSQHDLKLDAQTRAGLCELFAGQNRELSEFIGRDLTAWNY